MTLASVPSVITSSPGGGRFDFDDGGTYCGGWHDGKAHGHGVCTGPKNVGEYSGSWNFGFEMSGVFKWANGAVYEGRWQNGKRHGVGVEYNGKWIYRGEWSQGLKGRYGVKTSSNSAVKYEGTWANGLQDGYGSETYSDGGSYQGQMCRGLRHGYGVRKSAPYGDSQLNNPSKNGPLSGGPSPMLLHNNSIQSANSTTDLIAAIGADDSPKPEDGFKPNIDRTLVSKNGFVLVAKPLDVPMANHSATSVSSNNRNNGFNNNNNLGILSPSSRRNSITNKFSSARIPNQTATILKNLRLRKQKSTSDLDAISSRHKNNPSAGGTNTPDELPAVPFTLSPEELDITDPTTVETYTGEWKQDKRCGFGVCERSDGLKYEGQWHNDMKCGYGVTTFKDGSKEEGRYKNNILTVESRVKRFFQLGGSNMRQRIDEAVESARQAQEMALKKSEIADTRAATARDKAEQANTAAIEADRDSQIAYSVARQYNDSQQQLAINNQQQPLSGGQIFLDYPTNQSQTSLGLGAGPFNMMAQSPLPMRRISQQQTRYNNVGVDFPNQVPLFGPDNLAMMDQQQQQLDQQQVAMQQAQQLDQNNHQQQYQLGNSSIEPFNGRRGSFRGGSQQTSSGYQSGSGGGGNVSQVHYRGGNTMALNRQPSTDPFGDLFDHYKSNAPQLNNPNNVGRQRRIFGRQTSLDFNQLRASVPRQFGSSNYDPQSQYTSDFHEQQQQFGGSQRANMGKFRMSSMDHAEENQMQMAQSPRTNSTSPSTQHQQQKLRHLVTSGEDLQQQQQQYPSERNQLDHQQQHQYQENLNHQDSNRAPTPTGSLFVTQQSIDSLPNYNDHTPSPDVQNQYPNQQQQQQQQQQQPDMIPFNNQVYPSAVFNPVMQRNLYQPHRDVHSLADEQLYLAGRRLNNYEDYFQEPLDKTEFRNYDFTISSVPRPTQRCMKRTRSLSRNTPIRLTKGFRSQSNTVSTTNNINQTTFSAQINSRAPFQRGTSPTVSLSAGDWQATNTNRSGLDPFNRSVSRLGSVEAGRNQQKIISDANTGVSNLIDNLQVDESTPDNSANMSHLTLDSLGNSSSGLINRKPSLQVRYDPNQMGGLMSREEVAALGHAQREQKRLEAELAEKRAKRPLLHLYLSIKELIAKHRLLISVVIVNIFLIKMFADLMV